MVQVQARASCGKPFVVGDETMDWKSQFAASGDERMRSKDFIMLQMH